ncbi:ABC transporter permease [Cellulomonas soli]
MTTATIAPTAGARPLADTLTMLRRNLLRALRYPGLTSFTVAIPVALLLLFVFVFGGAFGAGVAPGVEPGAAGRSAYLDYITPAILLFAVVGAAQSVAITAAMDAKGGIMARFKTMAISPGSVLGGPVLGTVIQALVAVALVLGLAVALGFRPEAGPLGWLVLAGLLALVTFAFELVVRRARPGSHVGRDGVEHPDAAHRTAVLRQRVRPGGDHAGRGAVVRPAPAVHPDHRDDP